MITNEEIAAFASRFGTPDSQVVRDHLISHVLAALGNLPTDLASGMVFFGGTALCRTCCPDLRLSEDIDLLIESPTKINTIERHLSRSLRREFPNHAWTAEGVRHDVDTRLLDDRTSTVRVQYVWGRPGWQHIPAGQIPVALRYSDLDAAARLTVPSPSGFSAMKLMAWLDRSAPRDLFDLAALAQAGHIDIPAIQLVKQLTGSRPSSALLGERTPKRVSNAWHTELGHQVGDTSTAAECLELVRQTLDRLEPSAPD